LLRIPQALPARFERATLSAAKVLENTFVTVGGYGLAREGDARSTGTFRTASLTAVQPHGPSRILLWAEGSGSASACQGDSGGPMASGMAVAAITSWSSPGKGRSCGGLTQGILVGPQRAWIDRVLKGWNRAASWSGP
jgi:hypothetical protein